MLKSMVLRRDDVIRAAVGLLDEVGLDKLTTRALTDRLGVRPGALYWHVRSKAELLSAIADGIMLEVYDGAGERAHDPGPNAGWADLGAAYARRMREAMLAHPDGARIVAGHLSMSEATLDATERGLAAMRAAGLSLSQAAYFGDALSSYVTGFVLQEQAMPTGAPEMPEIEPERYPNLVEWQAVSSPDASRAFEAGLSLIVGGMRAALTGET